MSKLAAMPRSPFWFLLVETSADDRVATYLVREHRRGRWLAEVVDDPFVRSRLSEQGVARLLERPELVRALADDEAWRFADYEKQQAA